MPGQTLKKFEATALTLFQKNPLDTQVGLIRRRSNTLSPLVQDFLHPINCTTTFRMIGSNGFINNLDLLRGQGNIARRNIFLRPRAISKEVFVRVRLSGIEYTVGLTTSLEVE